MNMKEGQPERKSLRESGRRKRPAALEDPALRPAPENPALLEFLVRPEDPPVLGGRGHPWGSAVSHSG